MLCGNPDLTQFSFKFIQSLDTLPVLIYVEKLMSDTNFTQGSYWSTLPNLDTGVKCNEGH